MALRAVATPAPWLDFWELCVDETVCPDDGGRGRGTQGTVGTREPTLQGGGSVFSPQHGHIGRARAKKLGEELLDTLVLNPRPHVLGAEVFDLGDQGVDPDPSLHPDGRTTDSWGWVGPCSPQTLDTALWIPISARASAPSFTHTFFTCKWKPRKLCSLDALCCHSQRWLFRLNLITLVDRELTLF